MLSATARGEAEPYLMRSQGASQFLFQRQKPHCARVCGLLGATKICCCAMYHADQRSPGLHATLIPHRIARSLLLNSAPVNGIKRSGGGYLDLEKSCTQRNGLRRARFEAGFTEWTG
jgi:hypothetical protein